jgi:hypothetical protein
MRHQGHISHRSTCEANAYTGFMELYSHWRVERHRRRPVSSRPLETQHEERQHRYGGTYKVRSPMYISWTNWWTKPFVCLRDGEMFWCMLHPSEEHFNGKKSRI